MENEKGEEKELQRSSCGVVEVPGAPCVVRLSDSFPAVDPGGESGGKRIREEDRVSSLTLPSSMSFFSPPSSAAAFFAFFVHVDKGREGTGECW